MSLIKFPQIRCFIVHGHLKMPPCNITAVLNLYHIQFPSGLVCITLCKIRYAVLKQVTGREGSRNGWLPLAAKFQWHGGCPGLAQAATVGA